MKGNLTEKDGKKERKKKNDKKATIQRGREEEKEDEGYGIVQQSAPALRATAVIGSPPVFECTLG